MFANKSLHTKRLFSLFITNILKKATFSTKTSTINTFFANQRTLKAIFFTKIKVKSTKASTTFIQIITNTTVRIALKALKAHQRAPKAYFALFYALKVIIYI